MARKLCHKCNRMKYPSAFNVDKTKADGLSTKCLVCTHKAQRKWYLGNKVYSNARTRAERAKLRYDVLSHYSRGEPKCSCCGEVDIEFLAIDHTKGGGSGHRRKLGSIGRSFPYYLRKMGYPKGYRVLCHNCNWSSYVSRVCAHKCKGRDTEFVESVRGGQCECCEEENPAFLSKDHIHGGGTFLRRKGEKTVYPQKGIRLLCHNCNKALGHFGYCPHDRKDTSRERLDAILELGKVRTPVQGKLNPDSVKRIRALLGKGIARKDIAEEFDVSLSTLCLISQGKIWRSDAQL